jgi:hypothetical protein
MENITAPTSAIIAEVSTSERIETTNSLEDNVLAGIMMRICADADDLDLQLYAGFLKSHGARVRSKEELDALTQENLKKKGEA